MATAYALTPIRPAFQRRVARARARLRGLGASIADSSGVAAPPPPPSLIEQLRRLQQTATPLVQRLTGGAPPPEPEPSRAPAGASALFGLGVVAAIAFVGYKVLGGAAAPRRRRRAATRRRTTPKRRRRR